MVDIISKKDGPRECDVKIKKLIDNNRGTINQMADVLSGGRLSAQANQPARQPVASTTSYFFTYKKSKPAAKPYVRLSHNGRVVIVDQDTSKQTHFIGEIRVKDGNEFFRVATKENGFFSEAEDEIIEILADLDGCQITDDYTEDMLKDEISEKLGIEKI